MWCANLARCGEAIFVFLFFFLKLLGFLFISICLYVVHCYLREYLYVHIAVWILQSPFLYLLILFFLAHVMAYNDHIIQVLQVPIYGISLFLSFPLSPVVPYFVQHLSPYLFVSVFLVFFIYILPSLIYYLRNNIWYSSLCLDLFHTTLCFPGVSIFLQMPQIYHSLQPSSMSLYIHSISYLANHLFTSWKHFFLNVDTTAE